MDKLARILAELFRTEKRDWEVFLDFDLLNSCYVISEWIYSQKHHFSHKNKYDSMYVSLEENLVSTIKSILFE